MARAKQSMDGNTAAAHVAYAYTEVAGIYPITPSSPMADSVDMWSAAGQKNIFDNTVKVVEMESEAGAAGTVHGSLAAGALTTTFTASQGLLLMIPNMYKIAGEQLPSVFHVSARTVSTHALNIFGDHSDVYACRQTGFAMLAETNPQEVMDLSPVAHLAALEGKVPFINFFDGFRTSHEIQKIEKWDYEDLKEMCPMDAVEEFRRHALNPEHPAARGSHENGDVFFQHREACNKAYDELPAVVEKYMKKVNEKLGTDYDLFNYYGAPDADRVIIAMGSICDVAEEVIDYLTAKGEKVGLIKVRLYRPWSPEAILKVIPETAKKIAVLDRTKEPGSLGDPLYLDVAATLREAGKTDIILTGGRYGLGSKDTPPSSVFAVYKELEKDDPKPRFTIGIVDDVTNLSLPEVKPAPITSAPGTKECKFWGLGGDGTVGANKNSTKIIGDHTDKYIQAYFQYDSKKTGGVTISHLRFGDNPIKSPYYINQADFVACHNPSYVVNGFKMVQDVKPGGVFMINCQWSDEELEAKLNAEAKKYIADNNIQLYTINAIDKAIEIGMGKRTNTILQSAFFKLADVMPIDEAVEYMKQAAKKSYSKKGDAVVEMNYKAIDAGVDAVHKVEIPASWSNPEPDAPAKEKTGRPEVVKLVNDLLEPISKMDGDSLPVSAFMENPDGQFETGASAYEKRGTAVTVPVWDPTSCVQCNNCAFVCSHATIRPFLMTEDEVKAAPSNIKVADTKPKAGEYKFTMSVSPLDCMGCGECITVCPAEGAIKMVPQESQAAEQPVFDYLVANVGKKDSGFADNTPKGSQFNQPLLEFSGSCAGCAETSYARLITQLFGEQMYISNATGCSSIWGNPAATSPYTVNKDSKKGPAWSNSLFEDNAEHGLGMYIGQKYLRDQAIETLKEIAASEEASAEVKAAIDKFMETKDDTKANAPAAEALIAELEKCGCEKSKAVLAKKDYLSKKSVWIFGGDGWAYDIGFGGLDHVLASGENVNVMVFDTEMYSNTGGQASKASNIGEVCQFAAAGKEIGKKSLAEIAMSYGYVYVAQIALGANPAQTVKAITEAEAYNGPSLIIGYAPCELHGIAKGGMNHCQDEMKKAVKAGYWNLFSFNPQLKAEGKNPFTFASEKQTDFGGYQDFLNNEARYTRLVKPFPERAEKLFKESEEAAKARYEHLQKLVELYK
ncbi:pyruvate:ferredoxin (flavodoxin) oxidoreductase [bacterium D16-51]|nr:pyruvate:ferredoxin (flavodoxin) oxidoreductase [bacterium D16-59]RKI62323.1 pyruvate:ferredoxin (flavodoxin) oxidoreductase [bacterium D16-51]